MAQPLPVQFVEHDLDKVKEERFSSNEVDEDEKFEDDDGEDNNEDEEEEIPMRRKEDVWEHEELEKGEEEETSTREKEIVTEDYINDDVADFIKRSSEEGTQYEYSKETWEVKKEGSESESENDMELDFDPKEIENEDDDIFYVPKQPEPEPDYDADWDEKFDGLRIGDERWMALMDQISSESPYLDYVPKITSAPVDAIWELWDRLDYQEGRWGDDEDLYTGPLPDKKIDMKEIFDKLNINPEDLNNNP